MERTLVLIKPDGLRGRDHSPAGTAVTKAGGDEADAYAYGVGAGPGAL